MEKVFKCKGFFDNIKGKLIKNCYLNVSNSGKLNVVENNVNFDKYDLGFVIPPFFDAHVHLFLTGSKDLNDRKKELNLSSNERKKLILQNINKHLECGIVSVKDAGDNSWSVLEVKENVKDFRIIASGKALYKKGRYGSFIGIPVHDTDSLIYSLNLLKTKNVDVIKVLNSGVNSVDKFAAATAPQFSDDEFKIIKDFSHKNNLQIMVHANGEKPVKIASEFKPASIEHGFFLGKENIEHLVENSITVVPTFSAMYNLIENKTFNVKQIDIIKRTVEHHLEEISRFIESGGRVALGTDAGSFAVNHGESFFQEIRFFIEKLGFDFDDVLKISTVKNLDNIPFLLSIDKFDYKEILNGKFQIIRINGIKTS